MTELRWRFRDLLADWKDRDHIKMVRHGWRPVAEYTEEFRDLACHLNCPEDILVSCFKDELSDDLYHTCIARGTLVCLHDWCILAKESEIDQAWNQYPSGRM